MYTCIWFIARANTGGKHQTVMARLHVPSSHIKTGTTNYLRNRMVSESILSIRMPVTTRTMINFEGSIDGTCKWNLIHRENQVIPRVFEFCYQIVDGLVCHLHQILQVSSFQEHLVVLHQISQVVLAYPLILRGSFQELLVVLLNQNRQVVVVVLHLHPLIPFHRSLARLC